MPERTAGSRADRLLAPANCVSGSRFVLAAAALGFAYRDRAALCIAALLLALLSDAVDGPIARKTGSAGARGARLDSWADLAVYLSLPFCVWWLWPDIIRREAPFVAVTLASYLLPITIGFLRFRRLTSYHTWSARYSVVLMWATVILLLAGVSPWPFRLCTPLFVLTAIENIAITTVLPEWRADVTSLRHVLRERRAGKP
jgi:CDP-diacylglycerol--glycerol-3-phosphate 3-phosphatidyltransferase